MLRKLRNLLPRDDDEYGWLDAAVDAVLISALIFTIVALMDAFRGAVN